MTRARQAIQQHELEFHGWGGARLGSGRKPSGAQPRMPHDTREALSARHPVHVTTRLHAGLPSLRRDATRVALERALMLGAARFGFRLAHYSLQSNHIHLIAEAADRHALSCGVRALLVRIARALNRLWRRRGSVFVDRYHAHQLRTPREVRNAIVYVLQNARHHGLRTAGVDVYSSARWFDGWMQRIATVAARPVVVARTWLLREGWRRHGLLDAEDAARRRVDRPSS